MQHYKKSDKFSHFKAMHQLATHTLTDVMKIRLYTVDHKLSKQFAMHRKQNTNYRSSSECYGDEFELIYPNHEIKFQKPNTHYEYE